jgi:hypothetical protein
MGKKWKLVAHAAVITIVSSNVCFNDVDIYVFTGSQYEIYSFLSDHKNILEVVV